MERFESVTILVDASTYTKQESVAINPNTIFKKYAEHYAETRAFTSSLLHHIKKPKNYTLSNQQY